MNGRMPFCVEQFLTSIFGKDRKFLADGADEGEDKENAF
jgi:hypothetical protein